MPVSSLLVCPETTSPIATGRLFLAPACEAPVRLLLSPSAGSVTFSSTKEFQDPQTLHCPSHLGLSKPQVWHTNTVLFFLFAMSLSFHVTSNILIQKPSAFNKKRSV